MGLKLEVGKMYRSTKGGKIGPMIQHMADTFIIKKGDGCVWNDDGSCFNQTAEAIYGDLIALCQDAPTGPVRTVTRKEIVPGKFGLIRVIEGYPDGMHVDLIRSLKLSDVAELRAAIATLTKIAEALEDQA